MTYVLYGSLGSGASCVEATLAVAGAACEFHEMHLETNEQRTAEFRALNPSGKVPALKLPEGGIVTESSALLILLAERHPEAGLLPAPGTPERAQALRWLAFMAAEIYPMVEIADYPERFSPTPDSAAELKRAVTARIRERMLVVEQAIAGPFFFGARLTALDIYAAMFSRWRESREGGWREAHIPNICAISGALFAHPVIGPVWKRHFWKG